ncbi:C4-dicarboxylate transporter DctA [Kineococcus sp. SYSU DK005]|uniref:C4-dicarboxylate transporter DctA n=1 Tax=Kineococcus sp. SYSU DK005 TaxID=3383126 RepID=UPI003D7CF288
MAQPSATGQHAVAAPRRPWYRQLYFHVIVAIVLGIALGAWAPETGKAMEPIGTTFISAMKMLIGPVVFLTIVAGIAGVADLKSVGVTGLKALGYFQIGTLLAMLFGLVAINLFRLGDGVNADVSTIAVNDNVSGYIEAGEERAWWEVLVHIVPESAIAPFVEVDILQIIFMAVLAGIALNAVGRTGKPVLDMVERLIKVIFKVLGFIMKAAPLGAFGAMAYAIGQFGLQTLTSLGSLVALFYITSALFVVVVLGGALAAFLRVNIFKLLRYLRDELVLVLGTSTAEPALPLLMKKLEHAGVKKSTVGLVVPTGYSFNLDGAAIYLSLAAVYIAQATNTDLSLTDQLGLLAVMLLTSKGAAGVAGGGFIALTATLSTVGTVPAVGIMLIFGIDKFMSECRALVNFCGNAVATLIIARWDRTLDLQRLRAVLNREDVPALQLEDAELDAELDQELQDRDGQRGATAGNAAGNAAGNTAAGSTPASTVLSPPSVAVEPTLGSRV